LKQGGAIDIFPTEARNLKRRSAGLLLYRFGNSGLEVFLVHPGGPFWARKDAGAWSIPKGEYPESEDALAAAKREFEEETGMAVEGNFLPLGEVKQAGGKIVAAWALEGDLDPASIRSNVFQMEWPPKSGSMREFPEVDAGGWFSMEAAQGKLLKGQLPFLSRLAERLSAD
jgi:predicted NUDIX family NTP pyrophosphohydrolase